MIATQEGLKMVMTITWRLSIFRKKKITFTKIAFEKFMKVLLHDVFCRPDIIQQGNANGKLYLYFLVMI